MDENYITSALYQELEGILAEGMERSTAESALGPIYGPPAPFRYALTATDVRRLTLYKWRYSLESAGFSTPQAEQLLFLKWLYTRRGR